jgi:uncharacterized protein (TIRG00374 family)
MTSSTQEQEHSNGKGPRLWGWHTIVSMTVALGILAVIASMVDFKEVWRDVAACNKWFLLTGLVAHYATYPIRGMRWKRCLSQLNVQTPTRKFGLLVFFYNFVDNLVPAKLGDVYGAHLARINFGITRSAALGSIVFGRLIDSWVVLGLSIACSWILFSSQLPPQVFWALIGGLFIAVVVTGIMLTFVIFKKALPKWVPDKIKEKIQSFQTGMWPQRKQFVPITLLTVLIWSLESVWIFFLVMAFGLELGIVAVVFLTMIPLMATAFPLTPSGTGAVEGALYGCLLAVGVAASTAASVTVVNRIIDYWLHIALGALAWIFRTSIGLRTWKEVPIEEYEPVNSLKTTA